MRHVSILSFICTFVAFRIAPSQNISESILSDTPHLQSPGSGYIRVEVTACDHWKYGSSAHSLQIQLKSQYDASPFFFVNELSSLPTNGYTHIYHIDCNMYYIQNMLFSIVLTLDDSYGYCMKSIAVHAATHDDGYIYHNFEHPYFGMGLILSNHCKYSYVSLSRHRSLFRCIDDYLELYTQRTRGVYKVNMHTCMHIEAGISAVDMQQNVYSVIMGKRHRTNVYATTDIEYIDHYAIGELHVNKLGHLIATNILFSDHSAYSHPLYIRNVKEGRIIGIKLECADKNNQHVFTSMYNHGLKMKIDGKPSNLYIVSSLNMGKYLVAFLSSSDRIKVDASTEIVISANFGYHLYVNVYVILDDFHELYQLPFIIESNEYSSNNTYTKKHVQNNGINWFGANKQCMELYGTTLTSIHSRDESILMSGFVGDEYEAWIGLFDFDISGNEPHHYNCPHCGWFWSDRSFVDYIDLNINDKHHNGEDCAFMDGKHETWNVGNCEKKDKHKFICGSSYWHSSQMRKFEINVRDHIDDISVISVGNDNTQHSLCIDSISVDYKSPIDITNNWIGGNNLDFALKAILKAPVCRTEVIGMNVLYETAKSGQRVPVRVTTTFTCHNYNRLHTKSTECKADRPITLGSANVFRMANHGIMNNHLSWASASNITLTTQQITSYTTTNQLHFDRNYAIRYVTHGPNDTFVINNIKEMYLRPQNDFWDIYEKRDPEDDTNGESAFDGQRWETVPLDARRCEGAAKVPASHALSYHLYLGALFTKVNVTVDLKLILCNDFLNQEEKNEDSHIVYLRDVSAQVDNFVASGCQIRWDAPYYINNVMACAEEQQLAISAKRDYIPRCNSQNITLYDGCQCRLPVCWCVDQNGDTIKGKAMHVEDDVTWQESCRIHLNCSNTEVII